MVSMKRESEKEVKICNTPCSELVNFTDLVIPLSFRYIANRTLPIFLQNPIVKFLQINKLLSPLTQFWKKPKNKLNQQNPLKIRVNLNLKPGEWVQVRSEEEIFATLDEMSKSNGLSFLREMKKFCGNKYRVQKIVKKIFLDNGEMRKMRKATIILEGVYCEGRFDCDRSCFFFWREEWLNRVNP